MGRVLRGALVVVVIVVVVAALSVGGLLGSITASGQPQQSGTIQVPGLAADATISRDVSGVTHIAAGTSHDLFFAQGWVHASERMWQMEIWRRIGAGRLAELFGESQVATDSFIRTVDWRGRGRTRPRRPLGRDPLLPRRLRRRGQRLPRGPSERTRPVVRRRRSARGPGHRPCRPSSRALDAVGHPHLGEGPGLGPGRQPGHRDLPDAGRCPAGRPRADRPAVPGLRPRPARDRGPGDSGGSHPRDAEAVEHGWRKRGPGCASLDVPGPHRQRHPGPGRTGSRDGHGRQGRRRLEQLGRGTVALGHRGRASCQRPAPRSRHAVGLVRQRPALPAHLGRLSLRRRWASPSPAPRA